MSAVAQISTESSLLIDKGNDARKESPRSSLLSSTPINDTGTAGNGESYVPPNPLLR